MSDGISDGHKYYDSGNLMADKRGEAVTTTTKPMSKREPISNEEPRKFQAAYDRVLADLDRVSKERLVSANDLDDAQREIARLRETAGVCPKCHNSCIEESGYEADGPIGWVVTDTGGCPRCLMSIIGDAQVEIEQLKQEIERLQRRLKVSKAGQEGCGDQRAGGYAQ